MRFSRFRASWGDRTRSPRGPPSTSATMCAMKPNIPSWRPATRSPTRSALHPRYWQRPAARAHSADWIFCGMLLLDTGASRLDVAAARRPLTRGAPTFVSREPFDDPGHGRMRQTVERRPVIGVGVEHAQRHVTVGG